MNETGISETSQYLTFRLGDEIFALDVSQVREVLDLSPITRVPRAPEFMRGVINVRGTVVPVVDLRLKFGLSRIKNTVDTRIVVMEILIDGETTVLGALADSVEEVIELDPAHIEPPPRIGMRWRTDFIKGIGKQEEKFIILLDIDRIFSTEELALVEKTGADLDLEEEEDDLSHEPHAEAETEAAEEVEEK